MRPIKILSVCGTGVVTCSMLSFKLTEVLEAKGYTLETVETMSGDVDEVARYGSYDIIVCTTPVDDIYGIPVLNATGFLIGINEEEFIDNLLEIVGKLRL